MNLYTLLESGFPAERNSVCLEVPGGRDRTWPRMALTGAGAGPALAAPSATRWRCRDTPIALSADVSGDD